jgi:glycosyltransferase involved in cell wall biosynthesis
MGYAYGQDGLQIARSLETNGQPAQLAYPLFNRIADVSLGVIVHTDQARNRVLADVPQAHIAAIPLAAQPLELKINRPRPIELQTQSAETVILASFGYIAPTKRIEQVLHALAPLCGESASWCYVLIGAVVEPYDLAPLIQQLGLSDRVRQVGFVDETEFDAYLQHIDIGLNLRSAPSGGEMSASLLRLLGAGQPTLVSNIGGFSELPADCVVKIDQDDGEIGQLTERLRRLINDPALRRAYGAAARSYVQTAHSYASVAKHYIEFVQESLAMAAHVA